MDVGSPRSGLPVILEREDASCLGGCGELAHWHDAVEVVSVTQGRMMCQTNQHAFTLSRGDLCLINRQQLHRLMGSEGAGGTGRTLVIGTSALVQAPEIVEAYVRPVLESPSFGHVVLPGHQEGAARLREKVDEVEMLLRERPLAFELELVACCHQIFRQIFCLLAERDGRAEPADANVAVVKAMISFIRSHYAEGVQLEDIARAGSVSKSTCSRLFKRYTGRSPVSYLIDYRLEVAAGLLRSGGEPVASVAQACGFGQQSYFARMFQRAYGTTPLAYRREAT